MEHIDRPNPGDCRWIGLRRSNARKFDSHRMVLFFMTEDAEGQETKQEIRAKYVVCPTCNGKGVHVDPNIDDNGISPEEFADDPEFARNYFSGSYNVPCYNCYGERVIPEPITDGLSETEAALLKQYNAILQDDEDFAQMRASERRMGA